MSVEITNHEDWNIESDFQEKKNFLLNQENFEMLMKTQREIENATEMRPTFKKLINELVTEKSLNELKHKLIEQMN